jgi:hypothetical protein
LFPSKLELDTYAAGDLISKSQEITGFDVGNSANTIVRNLQGNIEYWSQAGRAVIDPKTLTIISADLIPGLMDTSSGPIGGIAITPTGILGFDPDSNPLYQWDGTDWIDIGTNPSGVRFSTYKVCYVPGYDVVLGCDTAGQSRVQVMNGDASLLLRNIETPDLGVGFWPRYDPVSGLVYVISNNEYFTIDLATDKVGPLVDITFADPQSDIHIYYTGAFVEGRNIYLMQDKNNTQVRKQALLAYVTKPEFEAIRPGCELKEALIKSVGLPQITAEITATQVVGGVSITGQIIKAAIEYYYGRKVPDNYLDHVYALDLTIDENGREFKVVKSGNETFARASIVDNFGVMTPGKITITIDNELQLGVIL